MPWRSSPRSFLLGLAALAAVACGATAFPHPDSVQVSALKARDPEVRVENLEHGRSLYLQKCSSCHRLYEPASLPADAWPDKVAGMQREGRVHLTDEELTDMLRYLRATSMVARR